MGQGRSTGANRAYSAAAWSLLAAAAVCCLINAAEAKSARCFTTDDGSFPCQFRATARDGSFEISAPGKPTYILNVIEPGVANGFVNLGGRNVSLPGRYLRSKTEPECWLNDSTRTKICAR
jgi:hypothetical protein